VLAAQLLYPLIKPQNFHSVYLSTLFDGQTFKISKPIGSGEYGKVFSAQWPKENREVAIKEINLPLTNKNKKVLPVRIDEFSEIRLIKKLFNDKASYHNILEHYG
jgi:serine/threonine protein kinase